MGTITDIVTQKVMEICQTYESKTECTGIDWWSHIDRVTKYAVGLSKLYNADNEIVALGALLHDISCPSEYGERGDHHIRGAEMAESLLAELDYPQNRIERVKNCVLNHRGSVAKLKNTVEEECVADADALAHFDSIPAMFHFVYATANLSLEDGKERTKQKFEKDYNKLSERTKELIKGRYDTMMDILFSDRFFIITEELKTKI